MCGIFGYIGKRKALSIIFKGLKKLEYRGYDSAGIAVLLDHKIHIKKSVGNIDALADKFNNTKDNSIISKATLGIGHTRWATHGNVTVNNAHPHVDYKKNFSIVHNGAIDNYNELKHDMQQNEYKFYSQTDSEVIVNLINQYYNGDFFYSVQQTLLHINGSYAIGVLCKQDNNKIICARKDSPLIIGIGNEENFLASDISALLPYTNKMIFLENGDIAELYVNNVILKKLNGQQKTLNICDISNNINNISSNKKKYKHFMLKEIYEQQYTIKQTYEKLLDTHDSILQICYNIKKIYILACGTAYYAGLVSKFWFEQFTNIPTEVNIASEFIYSNAIINQNTLIIVISQSGETADTLSALRFIKRKKCTSIAVCNTFKSNISLEATYVMYTYCGLEIGVASTKAFTGQLIALFIFALNLGLRRKQLTDIQHKEYLKELLQIADKVKIILGNTINIKKIARIFARKKSVLYLGRYINYPIALEGALKLKEIAYIHAEGCATGEIKHGTLALIDRTIPVIVIATNGITYKKTLLNIEEIKARNGFVIALQNETNNVLIKRIGFTIYVPETIELLSPILNVVPLQLIAYYTATFLKHNVDQPRNLAKSVTVE
ncbi:MAG: glutamine--fructose-6-phosphate transaminase (isomerizing) [Endomicrobium sp.]|jgi:glucosamine--fructose-6-phosphate aminotransferase (isomerizing)|nr:glutamine--fructose-6-phosphate transaminase (isomerizing) [Endomicrobium sp.]